MGGNVDGIFELEDYDIGGNQLDAVPARLQDYEASDFADPNISMALVRSLKIELKLAGKRSFQVRKDSQEALDFMLDMYPEYATVPAEEIVEIDDLTIGSFATDSEQEKVDWLESLHKTWVNKRIQEDAQVHVVPNPVGEGFALDHVNPSLGFVNSEIYESESAGIRNFDTYEDVLGAAELGAFDVVDNLPEDRFVLEDVELFEHKQSAPEQIKSSFSAKSIEILDKKKRWPRLVSDTELTGWEAMDIAQGKGYVPEIRKAGSAQTEFWMLSPVSEEKHRIKLRKAEFDYLKKIVKKTTVTPTIEISESQKEILQNGDVAQQKATYISIGQALTDGVDLNDTDAQEAGKTYALFKDNLLKENDWHQYFDNLVDRIQNRTIQIENVDDPIRAQFTSKGLEILDAKKRWPKLNKEKTLSGWDAMALAFEAGYGAVSIPKDGAQTEYKLTHHDENIRDLRVKKNEFEFFDLVKQGEARLNSSQTEDVSLFPEVEKLLAGTWPTPSEIVLENKLALANTTSEIHRKVLIDTVAFLEENQSDADQQMQSRGFIDDQLGSAFHGLPTHQKFEHSLRSKHIAKSCKGDVYTLSLDDALCCTGKLYKKSGEVIEKDFGGNATLDHAVEQVKLEVYTHELRKTTRKQLFELSFKDYVQIRHSVDVGEPTELSGVSGSYIYKMMQEWGDMISTAAVNGEDVPESSLSAVRSSIELGLITQTFDQKNAIYDGNPPVEEEVSEPAQNQDVPFPFEMTQEEFRDYFDANRDNLGLSVKSHVDAFFSTFEEQEAALVGVKDGIYSSEADYIHRRSVEDSLTRQIAVDTKVLADYPDLTAPLPPVWSVPKKEFMNKMGSYRKAAECTDQEFLQAVGKNEYHKQEVQKALDAGYSVPDEVVDDYPDLDIGSLRMR